MAFHLISPHSAHGVNILSQVNTWCMKKSHSFKARHGGTQLSSQPLRRRQEDYKSYRMRLGLKGRMIVSQPRRQCQVGGHAVSILPQRLGVRKGKNWKEDTAERQSGDQMGTDSCTKSHCAV